jgi:hypothetical protein
MLLLGLRYGLLLGLAVGCGGQVQGGSDESGSPSNEPQTPSDADPGGDDGYAETELGACTLGRVEDYRDPCPWVANKRCYDEREMACNCACPRSGNSQCVSGFEAGAHGHVIVTCK